MKFDIKNMILKSFTILKYINVLLFMNSCWFTEPRLNIILGIITCVFCVQFPLYNGTFCIWLHSL